MNAQLREFEIEINRDALVKYTRLKNFFLCGTVAVLIMVFAAIDAVFGLLEVGFHFSLVILPFLVALGWSFLAWVGFYFVFCHRRARSYAETVGLRVDGPFLVYRVGKAFKTERKIHFRAIIDFSFSESPLMRHFGIESLGVNVAGTPQAGWLTVAGVVKAREVRDLLCQVDAEREGTVV
ncbi:MAG: PH domain-containing protein [Verrucomicrobiota bacterium]